MFLKSKKWVLVILLMSILVFLGIDVLKAKKPEPWEWQVELPMESEDYHLYGDNSMPYETTESEDVFVSVVKGMSKIGLGSRVHKFVLWIENTTGRWVGFKGLDLWEKDRLEELPYCRFPNCSGVDCSPPSCLEDFLEIYSHPRFDYAYFKLVIELDYDFEAMPSSSSDTVFGMLRMNVVYTDECLPDPAETYHNVTCWCFTPEPRSWGCDINIHREANDIWTIDVDEPINLRIDEHYRVYLGGSRGKGGKGKGPGDNKYPLVTTTPFRFKTRWTRVASN